MYANLELEMRIRRVKIKDLAQATKRSVKTISNKLNGKTEFTLSDMRAISALLGDKSFDYLFADTDTAI